MVLVSTYQPFWVKEIGWILDSWGSHLPFKIWCIQQRIWWQFKEKLNSLTTSSNSCCWYTRSIIHCLEKRKSQLMKNGFRRWINVLSPLNIRFTTGWEMQRWNVQTHLNSLLKRVASLQLSKLQEDKKKSVVVILANHQRKELWKRKPN